MHFDKCRHPCRHLSYPDSPAMTMQELYTLPPSIMFNGTKLSSCVFAFLAALRGAFVSRKAATKAKAQKEKNDHKSSGQNPSMRNIR